MGLRDLPNTGKWRLDFHHGRGPEAEIAGAPKAGMPNTAGNDVLQALGGSIFAEECKGDFAVAATRASAMLASAHNVTERADASIVRALVHILQGEPVHASTLLS